MREAWTGRLVGRMHNYEVTCGQLAAEMGVTKAYISQILSGKRKPPNARVRLETALNAVIEKRKGGAGHDRDIDAE
jgi:transcriptional regulator with XRE-family HTH domain